MFLKATTWILFEKSVEEKEPLHRLICGILGRAPGRGDRLNKGNPTKRWVVVLDGTYDRGVKATVEAIAEHLQTLLGDSHLTITDVEEGSIRIIIESDEDTFKKAQSLFRMGKLRALIGRPIAEISEYALERTQSAGLRGGKLSERFDDLVSHLLDGNIFLEQAIEILERSMILRAMEDTSGNQCAASKQLGIHRNTLQRKLIAYNIGAQVKERSRRPTRSGVKRRPNPGALKVG
jgi:hypothetical protein